MDPKIECKLRLFACLFVCVCVFICWDYCLVGCLCVGFLPGGGRGFPGGGGREVSVFFFLEGSFVNFVCFWRVVLIGWW